MTMVTPALAAFVSEAAPAPAALAAALAALPAHLPYTRGGAGEDARTGRVRAAVHWTACAALHHASCHATARDRTEQGLSIGLEVALRLLRSLDGRVAGGWDPVGAAVRVGAATAAARMDGLEADGVARAIGIAATQAAGLTTVAGTTLGAYQDKHAAGDGLQAAVLARAGMTAPVTGLEGRRGLYALLAPVADPTDAVEGLGERWLLSACAPAPGTPGEGRDRWAAAVAHAQEVMS